MLYFETKHPYITDYVSLEQYTDFEFGLHLHKHFEIIHVSEGALNVRFDDRNFVINKDEMCFILPMQAHAFSTTSHSKCQVCVFSTSFAPDFYEKYRTKAAETPVFKFDTYENIPSYLENKKSDRYALASFFYGVISLFVNNSTFADRNEKLHSLIKISLDYLDKNFDKSPSITELADLLSYDPHYCSCLFNKTFDKNFATMVNEYRISKAQSLLSEGGRTITDVAIACGYNCMRSFNRNYLKIVGKTPKEYLNNN
jgi:YesN/AraC family two-component response regulator